MLPPLIQRPRRSVIHRRWERGVTMALVALAIFSIIAMAGLSIDVGTLYQASAEAQRSADEAALAGAKVLSLSGMTGDPTNSSNQWSMACTSATQIAQTVGNQNTVGGKAPSSVTVTFLAEDGSNCASSGGAFGVNPLVQVQVVQANLPTYFARIWGRTGSSASATATAEVFNPSYSGSYASNGNLIPVQPRCVKPWIVPNLDPVNPNNPPGCTSNCLPFIKSDGTLQNPGLSTSGTGVIGEVFSLIPDCNPSGACNNFIGPQNFVNPPVASSALPPTLDYLPGLAPAASVAVPSCGNTNSYQEAIAGCDQSTIYQCGVQNPPTNSNEVDLNENPGIPPNSDTSTATDCLIHQTPGLTTGQDTLDQTAYPYQIIAHSGDPLGVSGSVITNSDSIVAVPVYDGNRLTIAGQGAQAKVNIVGFLQVFINQVDPVVNGGVKVTVLNVAGCGTGVTNGTTAMTGSSPVPVRLITPP
jgi:Flp pilus assembly protein TadG